MDINTGVGIDCGNGEWARGMGARWGKLGQL